jgi:hypothetical protein
MAQRASAVGSQINHHCLKSFGPELPFRLPELVKRAAYRRVDPEISDRQIRFDVIAPAIGYPPKAEHVLERHFGSLEGINARLL